MLFNWCYISMPLVCTLSASKGTTAVEYCFPNYNLIGKGNGGAKISIVFHPIPNKELLLPQTEITIENHNMLK
ncbi:hypothetical protein STEG23_027441, partial [Scotinomys teguina]